MFKALYLGYVFLLMLGAIVLILSSRLTSQLPRREPGLLFKPIHKPGPKGQLSIIRVFEQQETSAGLMMAELFVLVRGEAQEKGWISQVRSSSQVNLPQRALTRQQLL